MKSPKITSLFIFSVLIFTASIGYASKSLDRVRAVVGTSPILQSEVEDRHSLIKNSSVYSNILGINPQNFSENDVLDLMIEEQIVATVTEELNAAVSDADVQKQIESIAKQNNLSRDQLIASLKNEGIPFDAYARNIRTQLQKRAIIERELRANANVSDAELRNEYYKRAKNEFDLVILEVPPKQQKEILASFSSGAIKWDELSKKFPTTELGWIQPANLKKDLAAAIEKSSSGSLIGPHKVGQKSALIFISAERKGSDEEFESVKGQLLAELQTLSFNNRFRAWLDGKKKSMQIIVNN
jgi:parvulin-like peptidyl-prolyl isomerase